LNITGGRDTEEGEVVAKQIQQFYMGPRMIGEDTKEELVYVSELPFHLDGLIIFGILYSYSQMKCFSMAF
jgi:hypothetical protein